MGSDRARRCCCRGCGRSATSIRTNCRWSRARRTRQPGGAAGDPRIAPPSAADPAGAGWGEQARPRPAVAGPGRRARRQPRAASRHRGDRGRELRPARRPRARRSGRALADRAQLFSKSCRSPGRASSPPKARSTPPSGATACWRSRRRFGAASPPRDPVIAAGLTGGIPAMTELISVVAALDQGAVILPGLDRLCDAARMGGDRRRRGASAISDGVAAESARPRPADVRDWDGTALARSTPGAGSPLSRDAGECAERGDGW